MSSMSVPQVGNIIKVGPNQVRSYVYSILSETECDVCFIEGGKQLKQKVVRENNSWEFKETAGYVGGPQYQRAFDSLQGIVRKPKGQSDGRRTHRRK